MDNTVRPGPVVFLPPAVRLIGGLIVTRVTSAVLLPFPVTFALLFGLHITHLLLKGSGSSIDSRQAARIPAPSSGGHRCQEADRRGHRAPGRDIRR